MASDEERPGDLRFIFWRSSSMIFHAYLRNCSFRRAALCMTAESLSFLLEQ